MCLCFHDHFHLESAPEKGCSIFEVHITKLLVKYLFNCWTDMKPAKLKLSYLPSSLQPSGKGCTILSKDKLHGKKLRVCFLFFFCTLNSRSVITQRRHRFNQICNVGGDGPNQDFGP